MRLFLVLFAVIAACSASPFTQQGRIVGGNVASDGQFPHQASVRDSHNTHLCGGWMHSVKWVVSAAHCTIGRSIADTIVVVGTNTLSEGGQEYELSRIINHPGFRPTDMEDNLSLLEILYEIDLYINVRPIPMATENLVGTTTGFVAGWGSIENPGNFSDSLRWVSQATLTNEECRERHSLVNREYINDHMICTNNQRGVGMCLGDAGSALVSGGVVIGTVSWGYGGCGAGYPDVYTRVSYYAPWINGIVNSV